MDGKLLQSAKSPHLLSEFTQPLSNAGEQSLAHPENSVVNVIHTETDRPSSSSKATLRQCILAVWDAATGGTMIALISSTPGDLDTAARGDSSGPC
jgi:hypothetical protein